MASIIHATAHGLSAGDAIVFSNTDPGDSGIIDGQTYYVLAAGLTADQFEFSDTSGGSAFVLDNAITSTDITRLSDYTVVTDGVMDPPDSPATPADLTVTSVIHNNTVVLRLTVPSAAEAPVRSVQVQVTKAVPASPAIALVQSSQGDIGPATPASLPVAATNGNLILIQTSGNTLPTGFTDIYGAYLDFAAGNTGYRLGYKVASAETNSYTANTGEYVMAEFSLVGSTPLDPQSITRQAAAARMHKSFNPSYGGTVLVLGSAIRDAWNGFTAVPDSGYTLIQKNESNANQWSIAMWYKVEDNAGSYDPGISTSSGGGSWAAAAVAFGGTEASAPDWDKAMEHTLTETGSDHPLDIPILGVTRYAIRSRRQDVYGNYGSWSTVAYHTTIAGSDSLKARSLSDIGTNDSILMADSTQDTGLKWASPATPSTVGTANSEGTADSFTRGDHVHAHEAAHIQHDTTWAAKGDLIAATANDTAAVLPVGTNDQILMAESAETTGLKWVSPATPSTQAFGDAAAEGTSDTYTRGDHKHGMPAAPTASSVGAIATTFVDAKGDLITATADDTPAILTVGADDTILMADSAAAKGLKWVASASPSAVGTAAATGTSDTFTRGDHVHAHEAAHVAHDTIWDAKGDIVTGSGADTAVLTSVGADGKFLKADSGAAGGVSWATVSGSVATDAIWNAKGDIAAGTGADTAAVLTVGADDTILMADSTTSTGLKWVAAASPSAVGTAAATGTSDTFTRGDHVHAHEAAHVAHDTVWDAKGDLVVGTAADTAAILTAGSNDQILMAESAETTGLKWVSPATPSTVGTSNSEGTADTYTRGDHVHAHEAAHINHDTTWAAKGDLIAATANDTAAVLSVGADGKVLVADSSQTTGLNWLLGNVVTNVYTTGTGNWTKPSGIHHILVECIGGGGGGGAATNDATIGGGGGGGAYARKILSASDLSGASTFAYSVGAAGTAGSGSGGNGGDSTLSGTGITTVNGGGGVGGTVNSGSGAGGTATGGDINVRGGSGGRGGGDATSAFGAGGDSGCGFGGGGPHGPSGAAGTVGTGYGAGGGGGHRSTVTTRNGAVGTEGVIIITEFYGP